jgi:hypothetical protein
MGQVCVRVKGAPELQVGSALETAGTSGRAPIQMAEQPRNAPIAIGAPSLALWLLS